MSVDRVRAYAHNAARRHKIDIDPIAELLETEWQQPAPHPSQSLAERLRADPGSAAQAAADGDKAITAQLLAFQGKLHLWMEELRSVNMQPTPYVMAAEAAVSKLLMDHGPVSVSDQPRAHAQSGPPGLVGRQVRPPTPPPSPAQ
jgi:hypothetical protein